MDGIRQSKIVDGREYKYTTLDGKVVRETFGGIVVDYFYDNGGKPYKLVVDNVVVYVYVKAGRYLQSPSYAYTR